MVITVIRKHLQCRIRAGNGGDGLGSLHIFIADRKRVHFRSKGVVRGAVRNVIVIPDIAAKISGQFLRAEDVKMRAILEILNVLQTKRRGILNEIKKRNVIFCRYSRDGSLSVASTSYLAATGVSRGSVLAYMTEPRVSF